MSDLHPDPDPDLGGGANQADPRESGWTAAVRDRMEHRLPLTELLPTRQPAYVGSWVYVFGVVTIAALGLVVLSGTVLALMGSAWWHTSSLGRFFFYQTDYSRPLLFMSDGGYLAALAQAQKLTGTQWGMMNETGRYPGQAWLWLYTLWYQIPPYSSASNADLLVVATIAVLTLALLLVPFIPGVRDLPRWIPIHRLIWRRHYRG